MDIENSDVSSDRTREMLITFCHPDGKVICPRCDGSKVYILKEVRYRCKHCVYTFHDFTGRWISRCNLSSHQWLNLLKHFVLGRPVTEIAGQTGASYETTLKAVNTLRLSIMSSDPSFLPLLDRQGKLRRHCRKTEDRHCLGEGAPVFGLKKVEESIFFQLIPRLNVKEVIASPLSKRPWRTLVYTGRFKEFDALFFACCNHLRTLFAEKWSRDPVFLDSDKVFWDFTTFWLTRYRCFTPECCPLYLKELEFRFNNPVESWLPLLTKKLCSLVPIHRQ